MTLTDRKSVLFVLGTRPEAIKLAPVIRAFKIDPAFDTWVCVTGQHHELIDPFLESVDIQPHLRLDVMSPGQSLSALTSRLIKACGQMLVPLNPDLVFVQGDTTSAFAAAVAASQCQVAVAHVEAGLRSHRKESPFPEELNRTMIGQMAKLHFAPGEVAARNLRHEGITQGIHVVGNTIVDTLKLALNTLHSGGPQRDEDYHADRARKIVLVTLHRRESVGRPMEDICAALRGLAEACQDVVIVCPVHPNPDVQQLIRKHLTGIGNIRLTAPLPYMDFICLLTRASLVISDSGGVLEEAETLGVPVLIAREVTERTEALSMGMACLVGSDMEKIFYEARTLLDVVSLSPVSSRPLRRTFGDGHAAARILRITREHLSIDASVNAFNGSLLSNSP